MSMINGLSEFGSVLSGSSLIIGSNTNSYPQSGLGQLQQQQLGDALSQNPLGIYSTGYTPPPPQPPRITNKMWLDNQLSKYRHRFD